MYTQIHYAATATELEECSRELFPQYSTASKPTLLKRGTGARVVRWGAFVQLAARVKTVAIIEDRVFKSFGGSFTNRLLARNKLSLSKFQDAIPHLLRLAAVDPLEFIHLHRTGYFKAAEPSRTTAYSELNSQDSQDPQGSSASSLMDNELIEDEEISVCSADEYESDPNHFLFEVSVQYPERDLITISAPRVQYPERDLSTISALRVQYPERDLITISAPRVQFEVAHSTPPFLKAKACDMIKNLMLAPISAFVQPGG
eukprot:gene21268-28189_t